MSNTPLYQGQSIQVDKLANGFAELRFDRQGEPINKFDARTVAELGEAGAALKKDGAIKGLLVTSGKGVFIVGADRSEESRVGTELGSTWRSRWSQYH